YALAHRLQDLWRRFLQRSGFRQDTRDAVLYEQALLRALPFGHIEYASEVFDQLSGVVENWMPNRVQVPDRSIGQNDPVLQLVFDFVAEYLRQPFEYALAVLRVNQSAGLFEMRRAARA